MSKFSYARLAALLVARISEIVMMIILRKKVTNASVFNVKADVVLNAKGAADLVRLRRTPEANYVASLITIFYSVHQFHKAVRAYIEHRERKAVRVEETTFDRQ